MALSIARKYRRRKGQSTCLGLSELHVCLPVKSGDASSVFIHFLLGIKTMPLEGAGRDSWLVSPSAAVGYIAGKLCRRNYERPLPAFGILRWQVCGRDYYLADEGRSKPPGRQAVLKPTFSQDRLGALVSAIKILRLERLGISFARFSLASKVDLLNGLFRGLGRLIALRLDDVIWPFNPQQESHGLQVKDLSITRADTKTVGMVIAGLQCSAIRKLSLRSIGMVEQSLLDKLHSAGLDNMAELLILDSGTWQAHPHPLHPYFFRAFPALTVLHIEMRLSTIKFANPVLSFPTWLRELFLYGCRPLDVRVLLEAFQAQLPVSSNASGLHKLWVDEQALSEMIDSLRISRGEYQQVFNNLMALETSCLSRGIKYLPANVEARWGEMHAQRIKDYADREMADNVAQPQPATSDDEENDNSVPHLLPLSESEEE